MVNNPKNNSVECAEPLGLRKRGINIPLLVFSLLMIVSGIYAVNIEELRLYSRRPYAAQWWTIANPYKDILGWVLSLVGGYFCYRSVYKN